MRVRIHEKLLTPITPCRALRPARRKPPRCNIFGDRSYSKTYHSSSSTSSHHRPRQPPPPPRHGSKPLPSAPIPIRSLVALVLPLLGYATYAFSMPTDDTLNPNTFSTFTLVHHERISSTSSILTLRPNQPPSLHASSGPSQDPYEDYWTSGTWSLEIKQPQLSISRRYTPLPPTLVLSRSSVLSTDHTYTPQASDIRLLIRKYQTGEVSRYLHNLKVGATVDIRGPHRELDIPETTKKVLFLAGGTGVAPALQIANLLARRGMSAGDGKQEDKAEMRIFWANRRREEVSTGTGSTLGAAEGTPNQMITLVQDLEQKAAGVADVALHTSYFVDEDNRFIQQKDVQEALASFKTSRHSSKSGNDMTASHEKMIVVSGPDGFVEYFAGPRRMRNGVEVPGLTGGLLGQMKLDDWTVVRL